MKIEIVRKKQDHLGWSYQTITLQAFICLCVCVCVLACLHHQFWREVFCRSENSLIQRVSHSDRAQVTDMHYAWERKERLDIKRTLRYSQLHIQLSRAILYCCWRQLYWNTTRQPCCTACAFSNTLTQKNTQACTQLQHMGRTYSDEPFCMYKQFRKYSHHS